MLEEILNVDTIIPKVFERKPILFSSSKFPLNKKPQLQQCL